jgi:nucleoside 2-deoxyribosyltransferase
MKIYLAGSIEEKEYRKYVHDNYGHLFEIYDPLRMVDQESSELVNEDKLLITKSDCLVAYVERPSFGTPMEIIFAYERSIPVYVITTKFVSSKWVKFHATKIFNNIEDCFLYLIKKLKRQKANRED